MHDVREKQLVGLAGTAAAALFIALFCPWFHVTTPTLTRTHTGFELTFRPGTEDAWTTIAVFGPLLAACSILTASRRAARAIGSSLAALITTFVVLVGMALIGFVLVNPPSVAQDASSEIPPSLASLLTHHRPAHLHLAWAGFAALAFSLVGAIAVLAKLVLSSRGATRSPTPAWVLAFSLFIAAIGAGVYACGWARAWMPNVVVGSLTVGFTVTVVEGSLQRAERRRQQPRHDQALRAVNAALYHFLLAAANGYAGTNVRTFAVVLPDDFLGWISLLIDELPNADNSRYAGYPGPPPQLQLAAELRSNLDLIADRDREILAPSLAAAIGDLHDEIEVLIERAQQARLNVIPNADGELHECMSRALHEVADIAEAYFAFGPPIPPELIADINDSARNYHELRRHALDA